MTQDKAPTPVKVVVAKLSPASGSGDAAVQNLLAQRHVHEINGDKDAANEVTRQLAELGYM